MDSELSLMYNFCKISSLVCSIYDGIRIKKLGDKAKFSTREKKYAITEGVPSYFDFMSYMYFCGSAISGPWFEFKDFQNYMASRE